MITNRPTEDGPLNGYHTVRYSDMDGVIRPGDGYYGGDYGVRPFVPGRFTDRPIILNRPFTSPADLGYVFRDVPWKSLDFFSRYSGDLGLLDLFSLEEAQDVTPVVAGKVNLNTRRPEVLATILTGTTQRLGDIRDTISAIEIGQASAIDPAAVAAGVVAETTANAITYAGDLVPRILGKFQPGNASDVMAGIQTKPEREAVIRTLSAVGNTRTWNFMIDLVVQKGSLVPGTSELEQFVVSAQRRCWVHVAVDRITGDVVDMQKEWVDE